MNYSIKSQKSSFRNYIDSPEMQEQLYKRTLLIVVISQILGGAGLAAGVTVGALLAQDMLGTESFAGIPVALFTVGSALAALLVGRLSQRFGRRSGLATGFLAGGIGAIGVVIATVDHNIPLLFASLFIYGAGTATNLQARYAGTDLAKPTQRATAVSIAMGATTFGAVAGPNLVDGMGRFATSLGIPALAGTFILAAIAYILAGLVLLTFLHPDPFVVAKVIAEAQKTDQSTHSTMNSNRLAVNKRGIIVGATVMVLTQIVMIAIMTMTPLHMKHHGHGLNEVGLVIGIHIGAMYLPSLLTGILVDKIGRTTMLFASGAVLLAAGTIAAIAPPDSIIVLITALALLGLGWNCGLISGTALIVDATHPATRAKTQGTIDVLIALAGASGGAFSGIVVAHSSYGALSLTGGILSLLLIPVGIWSRRSH
ncbi:MFS transporter [Melghirimyces algeriensis]|uniref:Predicted arabinose efflux permease, MFS family n=1 Tax=Melghirimyces algeriensis TaxID=910412 RepID=A0A521CE37_9BACL|nr:MFS transporter [Melghirimyces algeriensis]SMO57688.1 Predicted arabinose efflux permease, MFS family [Melghirimyces algeriensis]